MKCETMPKPRDSAFPAYLAFAYQKWSQILTFSYQDEASCGCILSVSGHVTCAKQLTHMTHEIYMDTE